MSYKVVTTNNNKNDIVEYETGTEIVLQLPEQKARDICRKLNLGAGFEGFTPTFFTTSYKAQNRQAR